MFVAFQDFRSMGRAPLYVGPPLAGIPGDFGLYEDPNFATIFETEQIARSIMVNVLNITDTGAVVTKEQAVADWKIRCQRGFHNRNICSVRPELIQELVHSGDRENDQQQLLRWWLEVYEPTASNVPQKVYSSRTNLAYQLFSFLSFSGYWVETQQTVVTVRFDQEVASRLDRLQTEIETACPFIRTIFTDWGHEQEEMVPTKRFQVLEPSLSAGGGSFTIETARGKWRLVVNNSTEDEFGSLPEFLAAMAKRFRSETQDED
jgi:hypothetical protein